MLKKTCLFIDVFQQEEYNYFTKYLHKESTGKENCKKNYKHLRKQKIF